MTEPPRYESAMTALRTKAEQLLQLSAQDFSGVDSGNQGKIRDLLHELSVHQIELEMQQDELIKANHALNEARLAAEKSRDQFSLLFNLAPISFIVLDRRGIIRRCNQAFEALAGGGAQKLIGKTLVEFIDPSDRLLFDTHIKHSASFSASEPLQVRIVRSQRAPLWVSFSVVEVEDLPLDHGEQAHLLVELTDIDQLKKTQQHLEEARQVAEQANQAKSRFLSNMSHELRTPLNAILGFAQLIELDTQQPEDAECHGNVREILKAGDHLLALIEDVLDLSRVESGHLHLQPGEVNLAEVLNDAIALVREMAQRHGVTIMLDHRATGAMVKADVARLRQAVLNLLTNGIKYNRPSGPLRVWTDCNQGRVSLYVQDAGEGIPWEKSTALFKPFNRLGKEHTAIEGTGVGLALSKQLIEQMGGELGFTSQPNQGSTFWIRLPILQPRFAASRDDNPVSSIEKLCARILYIEDDERSIRILKTYLAKKAGEVELLVAETAVQGLDMAFQQYPDLILCDINLPQQSGHEVARILKNNPATHAIPIVALTANAMSHDVKAGEQVGFDAYLTKPVDWSKFENTIVGLIDKTQSERLGTLP